MEELAAGPQRHRERRNRRRASAAAAYGGDVFGGPPMCAAPFAGVPGDYSEVFGGVAASCSIPYLNLPPADACSGDGAGGYGEIFSRFDFGKVAAPYEDVFAEADGAAEEIASWSGSSGSSARKDSGELDREPSLLYAHSPNLGYDQHFDEEQFSSISFPPDGEQKFSMSYNKATRGRLDDLVEITTCMVEPSISYVVDSCNLSGDSETNHVPVVDSGTLANGENGEVTQPPFLAGSNPVADGKQHIPTCPPISENLHEDENDQKRSSTHSASSEEATSTDYPFLRVSNVSIQTPPIKAQMPSKLPSKLLNKKESKINGNSEVSPNSAASAAAAAIKEAMDFAEARLKAAKEMMGRKGDSFKLRKKQGHHRATKSTEIKENKIPEEVHVFEERLNMRRLAKEDKNYDDVASPDTERTTSAFKLKDSYDNEIGVVVPPENLQQMTQSGSTLDQLGEWTSGTEFYELKSHDKKYKINTAAYEGDNAQIANPFPKASQLEKGGGVTAGDSERYVKLWDDNGVSRQRIEQLNLGEDDTSSMEVEHNVPTAPKVSFCEERVVYKESTDPIIEEYARVGNYPESQNDDEIFEISSINEISLEPHAVPGTSSLSLEASMYEQHANDNKKYFDTSTKTTSQVGESNTENISKEGVEIPCAVADEKLCTSLRSHISDEHPEVRNFDEVEASHAKLAKVEDSARSCETQCLQTESSTLHRDDAPYEKDKFFSFVDGACLHNEKESVTELSSEALIRKGLEKFGIEEKADPQDLEVGDVDSDAGSRGKEATVNPVLDVLVESRSPSFGASENEEAEVLDVLVGSVSFMESNARACGTFDEGSDQFHESHDQFQESPESIGSQNCANTMDAAEDLESHGDKEEAKDPLLENSDQTFTETGTSKGLNDVYAEIIVKNGRQGYEHHSGIEGDRVVADGYNGYTMEMSSYSKDLLGSFSEASVSNSMQHLSQNAESVSAQISDESTPAHENLQVDYTENSTKICETLEAQKTGSKTEQQDDKDRLFSVNLKDQQYLVEDNASKFVLISREETPVVQRSEGRDNANKAERKIRKEKVSQRLDEEKEKECIIEKEQTKERPGRHLEEEKEREKERAKDRLAVKRATREAHERAFFEARATGERIALERITSARQRASAEAREKEEKGSVEAASEKASREARIKAERAAVERATAEARERAIEKAKAVAEAKERMEKFRSSFKDCSKATNLGTQFQRTASNNYGRSADSCNQVSEVESALRHKARSDRHQRTAERAEKALAEKNMRDMLAQREQAEKHRLSEFLDPEVKRWSNGKEGNLRALLSTLQYVLGSDSGWQSVPLTDLITAAAVKKAYRRATLCVHPDKLQQRGATIRQKYICEKVFDLLKEGWNKFNSEER